MQIAFDLFEIMGKLGFMLIVLGIAVLLSQALWSAFIVRGAKLVQTRQVLTLRDVVTGMGEDGVWLAYLIKRPIACVVAVFAGAFMYRAFSTHPGWVGMAAVAGFASTNLLLRQTRAIAAALTISTAAVLRRKKALTP